MLAALAFVSGPAGVAAPPVCDGPVIHLTPDYRYLLGSAGFADADGDAEAGSTFRWLRNGSVLTGGRVGEGLLLALDDTAQGANGEVPSTATLLQFVPGKWGSALALPAGGRLRFATTNNLRLDEGTIELWVALRSDGTNGIYGSRRQVLFHYGTAGGEYLQIAQSQTTGILFAGGSVKGQWESAYGGKADMRSWRAGEWHHLAFAYSASSNFMGFYVDGVLTAANNEGHYWAPAAGGPVFAVGGDASGNTADYWIDEFRSSGRVADADELLARARRSEPARANEIWLPAAGLTPGDRVVFEFTPVAGAGTGAACASGELAYVGIPITGATPPSTLLVAGTTQIDLSVETAEDTACAYAVGTPLPFERMTRFREGAGSRRHATRVAGLDPDPTVVNDVFVRCAAQPDYVLRLRYRAVAVVNPPFPRTGNLWGWWQWRPKGLPYMARVDLWLGAQPPADEIRELRRLNPHVRLLTSINAVENEGLPADFYLRDIHGQRIEVWPGSYRLNLTLPHVAEYQARFAYDTVLATDLMADGVFFDNVMTTQSWQKQDIYGNPVQIDADGDGVADDPAVFDAAWKAGVFHEISTFRQLMPHAIVSGHSMDIDEPGIAERFNGISLGFVTANVLEGEETFGAVWNRYHDWHARAVAPVAVMVESSPRDQIAYGYDYSPEQKIPPSTLEFARDYYPDVRFGLAFTLMGDGFFAHEYGDTWHGNDWWYDELDFPLGYPLGPAQRVDIPDPSRTNLLVNPGFETPIVSPWGLALNSKAAATLTRDTSAAVEGSACARIDVTASTGTDWHVTLVQYNRSLERGVTYNLEFRARSGAPRSITLSAQKNSPDWRGYGLWERVRLTGEWQLFTVPFTATETVSDARIQFFVGETLGSVWIDEVRVARRPPDVFRRDFTHGLVLLNGTGEVREVAVGPGLRRLTGDQAPMIERVIDDTNAAFSVSGSWQRAPHDSGEWKAAGPFYHSWGGSLLESSGSGGEARWELPVELDDTYTLAAWWPASPSAVTWTRQAFYEVMADGVVVVSTNLDQTAQGDQWHPLATVRLKPGSTAHVRLTSTAGTCVADALLIRSAARYNNGQPAERVSLQPLDGIVLAREKPLPLSPRLNGIAPSATKLRLSASRLTPGVPTELQRSPAVGSVDWTLDRAFVPTNDTAALEAEIESGDAFYRLRVP